MKREFVVGVTGASGAIYARRLLEVLCEVARVHIVISDTARQIAGIEGVDLTGFDAVYADNSNLAADIASGSFCCDGMAIVPCSMKTLAAVSNGFADNLILDGGRLPQGEAATAAAAPGDAAIPDPPEEHACRRRGRGDRDGRKPSLLPPPPDNRRPCRYGGGGCSITWGQA